MFSNRHQYQFYAITERLKDEAVKRRLKSREWGDLGVQVGLRGKQKYAAKAFVDSLANLALSEPVAEISFFIYLLWPFLLFGVEPLNLLLRFVFGSSGF